MRAILFLFALTICLHELKSQEYYFPPSTGDTWETTLPSEITWSTEAEEALDQFLEESNSKAFVLLKNGKIAKEAFYNEFEEGKTWYWASAGKSLTSFLVGMTQEAGLLDIHDSTSDYLGKWTDCDEESEEKITIYDQLRMITGLDYRSNVNCIDSLCLTCLNQPGEEWFYHNAPYTLLSYVLEEAHGENYTRVTNSSLFGRTGIGGAWVKLDGNRIFFSTPRVMARFGLLALNRGIWDNDTILADEVYFSDMISPSQEINPSYGYLWWLNGQDKYRLPGTTLTFNGSLLPDGPEDTFMAIGKNGQIIMVVPSQDLVIVRMGDNPGTELVPLNYTRDLWNMVDALGVSTKTTETDLGQEIIIYPNPSSSSIQISGWKQKGQIHLLDLMGNTLSTFNEPSLNVAEYPSGLYWLRFEEDGQYYLKSFLKQ